MKKILLVVPSFLSGGTTTSLINICSKIDKAKYDIDVFAINNEGDNWKFIEQKCRILNSIEKNAHTDNRSNTNKLKIIYKFLKHYHIDLSPIVFWRMRRKILVNTYDYICAFQEGTSTRFVSKFSNVKKVAWVRSMYSSYQAFNGKKNEYAVYNSFDKIVSVSKAATHEFLSFYPQLAEKTTYLYNLIDSERILRLAKDDIDDLRFLSDDFTIISIGRIDPVKRFSEIPLIAKELLRKGLIFKWYIIGSPSGQQISQEENSLLLQRIIDNDMNDFVIPIGRKDNPFPYLAKSDLLVSLSASETFNNTIAEAKILHVPVVTTDYACAFEVMKNNEEGIIVGMEKMSSVLEQLLSDKQLYEKYKNNLLHFEYKCDDIISKIDNEILN